MGSRWGWLYHEFFYTHERDEDKYPVSRVPGKEEERLRNSYRGYRYVEAIDPADGRRYRYTGSVKAIRKKDTTAPGIRLEMERDPNYDLNIYDFIVDNPPAPGAPPRYGVTYEDISTPEEREYWVSGSSLKVIDLWTNEVIAERIGYVRASRNAPSAWLRVWTCPEIPWHSVNHTINFVQKVLRLNTQSTSETSRKDAS